jgi:hypothetical protein
MGWSAKAKYELRLSRWMQQHAYIDFHAALHNAMNALKNGDRGVAALFSQQARVFAEGTHQSVLDRLDSLDKRIEGSQEKSEPDPRGLKTQD